LRARRKHRDRNPCFLEQAGQTILSSRENISDPESQHFPGAPVSLHCGHRIGRQARAVEAESGVGQSSTNRAGSECESESETYKERVRCVVQTYACRRYKAQLWRTARTLPFKYLIFSRCKSIVAHIARLFHHHGYQNCTLLMTRIGDNCILGV
jgi:hypothetical protein